MTRTCLAEVLVGLREFADILEVLDAVDLIPASVTQAMQRTGAARLFVRRYLFADSLEVIDGQFGVVDVQNGSPDVRQRHPNASQHDANVLRPTYVEERSGRLLLCSRGRSLG
jgi:hypothetical protein